MASGSQPYRGWNGSIIWCLCAVLAVTKAACPSDAPNRVMMCTQQFGLIPPSFNSNAFVEKGYIEHTIQACRDQKLAKAVDCLEEITKSCHGNTDQEHFIRNMVDVSKIRAFIPYFCTHLQDYKQHAPCIEKEHKNLSVCVTQQRQTMMTKVKATYNMDYHMISTCKYMQAAVLCSNQVLTAACSKVAVDMIAGIFQAFQPPKCRAFTDIPQTSDNNDPTTGTSTSVRVERTTSLSLWEVTLPAMWLIWILE